MKLNIFGNVKKSKIKPKDININSIASLVVQNKKFSLYKFRHIDKNIYFVTGNEILLYSFLIKPFQKDDTFLLKDNGDDLSIKIIYDINEVNYASNALNIDSDNYEELGKLADTFKIEKSVSNDFIAREIMTVCIDGLDKIEQINMLNYKTAIIENTDEESKVDEEVKTESIENKSMDIKSKDEVIENKNTEKEEEAESNKKEEVKVEPEISNKNKEKTNGTVEANKEVLEKPVVSAVSTTTSDFAENKLKMADVSKEIKEIKSKTKAKIDDNYFIGYKINIDENNIDNTYTYSYELNKNREPIKVYFSPKDFSKILTTHMFITGKTGSGKTSFNNQMIHTLLYHGVSLFAYDIKNGSMDYSATIVNKPETKDDILKEINDSKYKGNLTGQNDIVFTKDDIPDEALKLLNPNFGGFKNRFGNRVIPLVIYNNPDEVDNIKDFTALNILDNELRNKMIELLDEKNKNNNITDEYNATRLEYKEGVNKMLNAYFKALAKNYNIPEKIIITLSDSLTTKIVEFMEKTKFDILPSNYDFSEWIKDYSIFGKELKPDSPEKKAIDHLYESNNAKKVIDFENGVNLYSVMKSIIFEMKTNFYITIRTNTDLVEFYIIYMYYLLLGGTEKLKLEGLEDNSCYTAVFIDEAHYLEKSPQLVKTLTDAQRTDRIRNRAWIFSSQRIFMKSFSIQESIGTYIFFSQQSSDISSQKTRFSTVLDKQVLNFIGTQNFAFAYNSSNLFVDENGDYLPKATVIKSFPNRAFSKDIMEYGVDKYSENIKEYLITNFKFKNEIEVSFPEFKISLDMINSEGDLIIAGLREDDEKKLMQYADKVSIELSKVLSLTEDELKISYFSSENLQFIKKLLLLIEINRNFAGESSSIIKNYVDSYNSKNNREFIIKIIDLIEDYKKSVY